MKTVATVISEALEANSLPIVGVSGPYTAQGQPIFGSTWHQKGAEWFRVDWPSPPNAQETSDADAVIQSTDPAAQIAAVETNQKTIRDLLTAEADALRTFRRAGTSFVGLSNAQKDALILRLLRNVEYLERLLLQRFDHAD